MNSLIRFPRLDNTAFYGLEVDPKNYFYDLHGMILWIKGKSQKYPA